jgi:hypothetical protein
MLLTVSHGAVIIKLACCFNFLTFTALFHHKTHPTPASFTSQALFTRQAELFCARLQTLMKRTDLITVNEAAKRKGVTRQAIHAAIRSGRLPAIEVASVSLRIAPEVLAAFRIDRTRQRAAARKVKGK